LYILGILIRYTLNIQMKIKQKISTWGNSLGIRLPQVLIGQTNLKEGDEVLVTVENGRIILTPDKPSYTLAELLQGATTDLQHEEIDWGDSVGEETW
jgi:antitoxin MazE